MDRQGEVETNSGGLLAFFKSDTLFSVPTMDSARASTSKQGDDITRKLSEMSMDSSVLTLVVSITDLRDTASTCTAVHIPANAGTTAFNMSMFNQFMDFMQSSSSSKRKRDEPNMPRNQDGQSKCTKPNISDEHQAGYKEA